MMLISSETKAQKVGLVLSGGGASGLAHIGVIKALEENHIPIDYITGTSMGALIGCMYSIGYTPAEMEKIVTSDQFKHWAYGQIEDKYVYYFKKQDPDASWITFKFSLDSALETSLPTNIISPIPVDFALMEKLSAPSAAAHYNFDSLMIPFRCVASDVEDKKSIIFKNGNLSEAVRASMSYPFYLKPIMVNGKLLFDGGLYNNFPSDVMKKDFSPDYVIGSNVSGNVPPPKADDIISQIKSMLISKTNYSLNCKNGIIIDPKTDIALFDFDNPQQLIDSGYAATMRQISVIKKFVKRQEDSTDLAKKRAAFVDKEPPLKFKEIDIKGLNRSQIAYVKKILRHKSKSISIDSLRPEYFRLTADDKIKSIYPTATYNPDGFYTLNLKIVKEKKLLAKFGGDFSNRPISEGFVSLQYNYLGKTAASINGNTYFGKLYTSVQLSSRIDFPFKTPLYIEPIVTYNRWDYFKSSTAFFEDVQPSYLIQDDQYGEMNIGMPLGNKAKFVTSGGISDIVDNYYQTTTFTQSDTSDQTSFNNFYARLLLDVNSLNRKQYATQGAHFVLNATYVNGIEHTQPGSTSIVKTPTTENHQWIQIKSVFDNYYKRRGTLRLGVYLEGVYSNQPFFNNYTSTILISPGFQPTPESQTLFLQNYHANIYAAGGLKTIITFRKNIELRFEGYIFQPYQ
ncbi:MAG TPA: patatin-like phospholipase family protein, partial [Bacteroidia bacterium]|nr:patatin-like phospholipase family protein [Bacteroidia bacterium]